MSALGFTMILLTLTGCGSLGGLNPVEPEVRVEVVDKPIERPAPIVPPIDRLELKDLEWFIVTENNYEEIFQKIQDSGQEPVIFALSTNGYEDLSLNISELRKVIQQQRTIIGIYEKSYEN